MTESDASSTDYLKSLAPTRRWATFAMAWERAWPLLLPALGVVAGFLIVSWFGLWPMMVTPVRMALILGFVALFAWTLWPIRLFKWPLSSEVDTRIERSSALSHRPVTAQSDRHAPVSGSDDSFAKALWREHQDRMAKGLDNLNPGTPSPQIAKRDPWAIRSLVVLTLFIAFFAGRDDLSGNISDAFRDHTPPPISTARIDAWIKPPAYTNKPPIFLSRAGGGGAPVLEGTANVPEGSELVVRILGLDNPAIRLESSSGVTELAADGATGTKTSTKKSSSATYTAKLDEAGRAVLSSGEEDQVAWAYTIIPDEAPTITYLEDPKPSQRGALEFAYELNDDYGVAKANAVVKLLDKVAPDARPLIDAPAIQLTVPSRRSKANQAKTSKDLSSHPWAGAEADITLIAEDDAGQAGVSETKRIKLPGRIFTEPLAKAVVYERRRLALDANRAKDVANMLDIITDTQPEIFIPNLSHYTALRVAYRHILRSENDDQLREGLEMLWQLALAIEDGDLSLAERRLREAQERLAEAIERGASDEEIERLMQEMRQAMNEFMREMAEQMAKQQPNQQAQNLNENMQNLRQQDIDKMMQQIEDLAKSGSKDAARELLRQLQEMMNNLQMAQPQQNQQNDQFSEQMNKLGEMMRQQQELMDQTFDMQRRQQEQRRKQRQQQGQQQDQQQQGQQGQQQQGQQKPMTPEEFAEAMKKLQEQQGKLQEQMRQMEQAMKELGVDPGNKMNEAGEAMGQAEGNLGEGQTGEATGNQGRALQAMREGAQKMMRDMQQQAGEQGRRGERGRHGEQTRSDSDPLGRQSKSRGPQLGNETKVPGEIDAQRAREILEAIRKRLGETARPKLELDYLDRLLPTR